jgi:hypothetical protein
MLPLSPPASQVTNGCSLVQADGKRLQKLAFGCTGGLKRLHKQRLDNDLAEFIRHFNCIVESALWQRLGLFPPTGFRPLEVHE